MEEKKDSRWGIVIASLVLFIFTSVLINAFQQKTSVFIVMWMLVGFYGYKANLDAIKKTIKIFTLMELALITFIYLFVGNSDLDFVKEYKKDVAIDSLTIFAIMLIPSALIYMSCSGAIKINNVKDVLISKKIEEKNTTVNFEEKIWELVATEFETDKRKKGLYAKLFAETNGDEVKIKAMYYKIRVEEMLRENTKDETLVDINEVNKVEEKTNFDFQSDEECISEGLYKREEIKGFSCLLLSNGKAVIDIDKKQIIYRDLDSLKKALSEYRVTKKFTKNNLVSELNKS